MPSIDISADASQGVNEVGRYGNALDAVTDRIEKLISVTNNFNRKGELTGATVRSQTGAFETLTQSVNKAGVVVASFYTKNEEAARRAADRIQATQDRADQKAADALTRKYDREEAARQKAIDKEIAGRDRAAAKAKAQQDKEIDDANKKATLLENIGSRIGRTIVNTGLSKATSAVQNLASGAIEGARDLQVQASLIRTISQGRDQQSFGKTTSDIRGVSDATGFDIKDVGKAFYDATSNQVTKGAGTADFVKSAAEFARVTGSTLPDAVNLASTAINSFGLSSADAEKIFAIFFKTIDEGRVVASEMASTLGRLYPLADQVGVSMTEVNAAIAITTQKGVKTNDAITLMSNLLVKLEKPTEQTAEFFKSLGVNSGEAAIQLYGFTGLIKKMVDAVNSGQVPVSAFFDEIRGRKQFAVFQQSIDQIEEFNKKLQDTKAITSEYGKAKEIRAESPGDQLTKEANKAANVFKVEFGQAVLENLNIINKWVGGVEGLRDAVGGFKNVLVAGGIAVTGYAVVTTIATLKNYSFAVSFTSLKASAIGAYGAITSSLGGFIVVAGASYIAAKNLLFRADRRFNFVIDPEAIELTTSALERFKVAAAGTKEVANPFASLDKNRKELEETFKDAGQILAGANISNNKELDDAKEKAKAVGEALKVSFSGFTDVTKKGISDIRKGITDAEAEIKRSKRSLESYGDKGQEALFNFRSRYANDDFGQQKILLTQQKVADTQKRADELFAKGTEESIAEGRKLYESLITQEVQLEELKVEHRKKQFEADLQQHPERHNFPGGNIFSVDDSAITARVAQLTAQLAANEERVLKAKTESVKIGEKAVLNEENRLTALSAALKKYENIDLYNKAGDLKDEFKTQGRFDPAKFNKALDSAESDVRASAGGDVNTRFQLEIEFSKFRIAKSREAAAQDRAEFLKSSEARFAAEKDGAIANIERIKGERAKAQGDEKNQFNTLIVGEQNLAAFNKQIRDGGKGAFDSKEEFLKLDVALQDYQKALANLKATKRVDKDSGVEFFDPVALEKTRLAYGKAIDATIAVKNAVGNRAGELRTGPNGTGNTASESRSAIDQAAEEAKATAAEILRTGQEETQAKRSTQFDLSGPIKELKAQFPQLADQGSASLGQLNQSFKTLANGGVKDLLDRLQEIQRLTPKAGPPTPAGTEKGFKTSFNDAGDSGEVYAAEGGVVGQFPGQPRGVDRYPVWAAKGEYIIDADTSAMYAPMLNAIMQRRMPRYMAEGGVVGGGTTNIGDINVTVNGATTNAETARVVGNRLERQLRQNNIRLDRR